MTKTDGEARRERLAAALRANLKRRKMHGRAGSAKRDDGGSPEKPDDARKMPRPKGQSR